MYHKSAQKQLFQQNRPCLGYEFYGKEAFELVFLIKFGLSDLKLVDIGAKIIQIGPEMPFLGLFVIHVQKPLFCTQYWQPLCT